MDDNEFKVVQKRNIRPNRKEVLDKVASGDMNPEEAEKLLKNRPPLFVVTRTGAIALYNLQHYPIILYADQWEKLSSLIERGILKNFIEKNKNIVKRRYVPQYQSEGGENLNNVSSQNRTNWNDRKFNNMQSQNNAQSHNNTE
jgi:hypothetical protein